MRALIALLTGWLVSLAAPAQGLDTRPPPQTWALQVAALPLPAGARLALRGDQPPLSWQRGLPFERQADGHWRLVLQGVGALAQPLQAKLVVEDAAGAVLRWERGDNRRWAPGAPPGPMRFDVKEEDERLWQEVLAADRAMFEAFNRGDAAALAPFFSERLEFFHDRGGLAGKAQTLGQLAANFQRRDRRVRRELLDEGQEIHPLPGVGAMQIGRHRFCSREGEAPEQCSVYGFSTVWEKTPAGWQQLRVLSYGH